MKILKLLAVVVFLVLPAGLFIAWATSPDPAFNPATFEDEALVSEIAPIETAVTLAQFLDAEDKRATMIVLSRDGDRVIGIDLRELGATSGDDPFAALEASDLGPILDGNSDQVEVTDVALSELLPTGTTGIRHIGTGTNFPEHAAEANSNSVFQFPKFGPATPNRTQVNLNEGQLLDYEVELCIRFDREIRSAGDFDAAAKGVFLCGDFTDRAALISMADPDNLDSGSGFSDSKSGPDYFPTGPFLVVSQDWESFVDNLRMTTSVNGDPRQDARGSEMVLGFGQLAEKALGDMKEPRFLYQNRHVKLSDDDFIGTDMTVMSGTGEGVISAGVTRGDLIEIAVLYVMQGGPLSGESIDSLGRRTFIASELESGNYLKAGDLVRYDSNFLGDVEIEVTD